MMSRLIRHASRPERVYRCDSEMPTIDSVLHPISSEIDTTQVVTILLDHEHTSVPVSIATMVPGLDDHKLPVDKKKSRLLHAISSGIIQWLVIEVMHDDDVDDDNDDHAPQTKTKWVALSTKGTDCSSFINAYRPKGIVMNDSKSTARRRRRQSDLSAFMSNRSPKPAPPQPVVRPPGTIVISTTERPPEILAAERKKQKEKMTSLSGDQPDGPRERTRIIAKFLTAWLDRNYSTVESPNPPSAPTKRSGRTKKRTSSSSSSSLSSSSMPDYSLTGVLATTGEKSFDALFRRVEQEAEEEWRTEEAQRHVSAECEWSDSNGQLPELVEGRQSVEAESAVLKDIGAWFNAHCAEELAHFGIGPRMLWQVYFDHAAMSERRQNVIIDLALQHLLDPRDFMTGRLNAVSKIGRENDRFVDTKLLSKYESPEDHDRPLYSRVGYLNARLKNQLHEFCDRFTRVHWLKRFCRAVLRDVTSCMKHHERLSRQFSSSPERFVNLQSPIDYELWLRQQPAIASALASIEKLRSDNVLDFVPLSVMAINHRQWTWQNISRHFRTVLHIKGTERDDNVQVALLRFIHHPTATGGGMWLTRMHHRASEHCLPIGVWLSDTYLISAHWRNHISSWYREQMDHLEPIITEFLRRAESLMGAVPYGFVPPLLPHGAPIQRHRNCPSSFRNPIVLDPSDPLASWFTDVDCNWGDDTGDVVRFSTWRYLIDPDGHWDADDLASMTERLVAYVHRSIRRRSPYWNLIDDDSDDDDLRVPNDALGYDSDEDHDPLVPISTVHELEINELEDWWVNNVNWDLVLLRQLFDDQVDTERFAEWTAGPKSAIVSHMIDEFELMATQDTDCADDEDEDEDPDGDDHSSTQSRIHFPIDREDALTAMAKFASECVRLRAHLFAMHRIDSPSSFVFGRLLRTNRRLIDSTDDTDDEKRWAEIWTTPFAVLIDFVLPGSWCSMPLYRRAPTFVKRWAFRLLLWRYFPPSRTVAENDRRWQVWLAGRTEARRVEYQAMLQRSVRRSYMRWLLCWKYRLDALLDRLFNSAEEPDLCLAQFRRMATLEELATADETSRMLRLTHLSSCDRSPTTLSVPNATDLHFHSFVPIAMELWSDADDDDNNNKTDP